MARPWDNLAPIDETSGDPLNPLPSTGGLTPAAPSVPRPWANLTAIPDPGTTPEVAGPPAPTAPYGGLLESTRGYTAGLSDPVYGAGVAGYNYLTGRTPGFNFPEGAAEVTRGRQAYEEESPIESRAADIAGSLVSPAAMAIKGWQFANPLLRTGQRILIGGGQGAGLGAIQGATQDPTSISSALEGAKTGAAWGGATGAAVPAIGSSFFPPLTKEAQILRSYGVYPNPGEAVGGLPGAVENVFSHIPVVGAPIQAARETAQEQFNRAAVNVALNKVGASLKADTAAGHDAIAEGQQALSAAFNKAVPTAGGALDTTASTMLDDSMRNAPLNLNETEAKQFQKFVTNNILGKITGTTESDANSALSTATAARKQAESDLAFAQTQAMRTPGPGSQGYVDDMTRRVQQTSAAEAQAQNQLMTARTGGAPYGTLSGQDFQDIDSQLGKDAHDFLKSGDPNQKKLGEAYLELQGNMRDWLQRASPDNATDLQNANLAWRSFRPVQIAAGRSNDPHGLFTPNQLGISARSSSGIPQYAAGGALMQDFANAGKSLTPPSAMPHGAGVQGGGVFGGMVGAGLLEHLLEHPNPWAIGATALTYPTMMGLYSEPGRRAITGLLNTASTGTRSYGPGFGLLASGLPNYNQQPQP